MLMQILHEPVYNSLQIITSTETNQQLPYSKENTIVNMCKHEWQPGINTLKNIDKSTIYQ